MELYKWYKGDELPDREYDCVVVYHKRFQFYGTIETGTVIKKGFGKCVSDEGNYYIEDESALLDALEKWDKAKED